MQLVENLPKELHWNIMKYISHHNSDIIRSTEFIDKYVSKRILYNYMHIKMDYFSSNELTENSGLYISEGIFNNEICKNLRKSKDLRNFYCGLYKYLYLKEKNIS